MNNFLHNLARRSLQTLDVVGPRQRSLFEPDAIPGSFADSGSGERCEAGQPEPRYSESLSANEETRDNPQVPPARSVSSVAVEQLSEPSRTKLSHTTTLAAEVDSPLEVPGDSQSQRKTPSEKDAEENDKLDMHTTRRKTSADPVAAIPQAVAKPNVIREPGKLIPAANMPQEKVHRTDDRASGVAGQSVEKVDTVVQHVEPSKVSSSVSQRTAINAILPSADRNAVTPRATAAFEAVARTEHPGTPSTIRGPETGPRESVDVLQPPLMSRDSVKLPLINEVNQSDLDEYRLTPQPPGLGSFPATDQSNYGATQMNIRPIRRRAPSRASESRQPEPVINVTIGRIEVKATAKAPVPRRKKRSHKPVTSLDNYLQKHASGGGQ